MNVQRTGKSRPAIPTPLTDCMKRVNAFNIYNKLKEKCVHVIEQDEGTYTNKQSLLFLSNNIPKL